MIFLSVAWGIYGIGDSITLGRIGKKLFGLFISINMASALFAIVGYPLIGPALSNTEKTLSGISVIFNMILDIIPSSIVTPFAEGNTLQIIFMAIIIGTAMLFLGRRTETVAIFIEQINYLIQFLMQFVASTVPLITFLVILNLMISDKITVFLGSWKLLALYVPITLAAIIILFVWAGFILKVSPFKMLKKSLPLFLMALTTASSSACFDINMQITNKEMGVDSSLAAFGVPLGSVISRLGAVIYFQLMCYYFASYYNVSMSWQTIVILTISSVFIAIATPPIPGGAAASYVALLAAAGIPEEAMATVLSLNVIIDFIMTTSCVGIIPVILTLLAKSTGKLDYEKLKQ